MTGTTGGLGMSRTTKPRHIAEITSGTGNYTPQDGTTWLYVTLVPGGGAGGSLGNSSPTPPAWHGKPGIPVGFWLKHTAANYAYAVGAGGTANAGSSGNDGGDTTFGSLTAYGGRGGYGVSGGFGGGLPAGEANGFGKPATNAASCSGVGQGGKGAQTVNTLGEAGTGGKIIVLEF